jgi:hypothetical protein
MPQWSEAVALPQTTRLTDIMIETSETTACIKTTLLILLGKSDQHYGVWNTDKLIGIEKNNDNLLTIPKTKQTVTKTTNAPGTSF